MNLSKGLSERTVVADNISFGLRRSQDFSSISPIPSLIGIINADEFRSAIEEARQRARIRKHGLE